MMKPLLLLALAAPLLQAQTQPVQLPQGVEMKPDLVYASPGGRDLKLDLFLPKNAKPPYQTVLFFPGSNALLLRKFSVYPTAALDGILRSGRAVIYPVYKSTYERGDGMETDVPDTSATWRDHLVMWTKDASRALDYVDSRPDLDHEKIAYYGYSWGAVMGAIIPEDVKISVSPSEWNRGVGRNLYRQAL